MRNNPDDLANQFISKIKKELKDFAKTTDYSTYDDYERHDDFDVFWDQGRNFMCHHFLDLIKKYEKGEFN